MELVREADARPGGAVYEFRTVTAIDGDDVTIGRGEAADGGDETAGGSDVACGGCEVTFKARPLSRLFKPGMAVYPYVATCGPDMAKYGETLTDPLEKFWWDTIMQTAVGNVLRAMTQELERIVGTKLIAVNPGSIQLWPITNQPALFSLIGGVKEKIGVTVAPSFLMLPLKSVSGIYFSGGGEFTHNCCLCERAVCPNRRAPFDPQLKAELEGEARSMFPD